MGHSKKGVGVPDSYKNDAHNKVDVLWKVRIKGRKFLADDIPLHMSLRVFDKLDKEQMDEVKKKVSELKISTPDTKELKFRTTIFHSRHNHKDYFMLKIGGLDKNYEEFFNHFKDGYGFTHPKFMGHVTIDKELYDVINKEGLEPDEIEFDDLTIERGAGNTVHDFEKSEDLEKGIKHVAAGLAMVGAMAGSPKTSDQPVPHPAHQMQNTYNSQKMLHTIASVETENGKNMQHKPVMGPIHHGESAIGKYGLMPQTIRETIHMHPDMKQKHGKALNLKGDDMKRYMEDNPGLEDAVAQRHLERLEHHFGQDPAKLGYAWFEGIRGTYKVKDPKTIDEHWHVRKIKDAYAKEK